MKATDILRDEHETILDVLAALESIGTRALAGAALDRGSAQEVLDFLREFLDRCHHGKEERLFFPALVALGLPREVGPLAVMSAEHEEGRWLVASMVEALADANASRAGAEHRFGAAAAKFVALLRAHIDKENGVLFPMGDGMLTEVRQAALVRDMEHFEHADMEVGAHGRFLALARSLCERFGVERAARPASTTHSCCGHGPHCT
ncbi:MAG: hemerythrin [Planctomycetes bacterium]|nr:hemerythrin [Planctomycetota bacterium]